MIARKLMALLLAAIILCAAASAEENTGAKPVLQPTMIPENTFVDLDLDGDGVTEKVYWKDMPVDEYSVRCVVIVATSSGSMLTFEPEYEYTTCAYAADLDGDSRAEFLISGDQASSDYITYCLHLFNGRIEPAMFADCSRVNYNRGYDKHGYGEISAIEGNTLTLSGSQDILGTWFGKRTFTLADTGVFEFADDGKWVREETEMDSELWEYLGLVTIVKVRYTAPDGSPAELPAGTRLMVTASDKQTADFVTDKGIRGTLEISPDDLSGWGFYVDWKPESQVFAYVPYAD